MRIPVMFLIAVWTALTASLEPNLEAYERGCYPLYSSAPWLLGAVLGVAAGAGTGYAAGNGRGKTGQRGERGAAGNAFEYDHKTALMLDGVGYVQFPNSLVVSAKFYSPGGAVLESAVLFPGGGFANPIFFYPAQVPKLVGLYQVQLDVLVQSSSPTAIAGFDINGFPFQVAPGFRDPSVVQNWDVGDTTVLTLFFPPSLANIGDKK